MSGFGYHYGKCPGGGGDAKAILAGGGLLAGTLAVEWVAAHAIEVLAVTAACGALAVAAVVALMRWGDRRERRHAIEHPFLTSRPAPATLTATVIPQVSQAEQPAIPQVGPAIVNHYHVHFDSTDREVTQIVRAALPGAVESAASGPTFRPTAKVAGPQPCRRRQEGRPQRPVGRDW